MERAVYEGWGVLIVSRRTGKFVRDEDRGVCDERGVCEE